MGTMIVAEVGMKFILQAKKMEKYFGLSNPLLFEEELSQLAIHSKVFVLPFQIQRQKKFKSAQVLTMKSSTWYSHASTMRIISGILIMITK